MPSRMDRYHFEEMTSSKRTKRNEDLYKSIYETGEYSNIEGIASISKKGEINLEKLKEMLLQREEKENEKKYRTTEITPIRETKQDDEDRTYDIRDVLVKAKTETKEDNRYRSLDHAHYEFLQNLKSKDLKGLKEDPEEERALRTLIDTITSTSTINKLGDNELSLEMLSELKPTGKTIADNESLHRLIETEIKKNKELELENTEERDMDQTFFTTGLRKEDFEALEDLQQVQKKEHKFLRVLFYILGIVLFIIAGYFIFKLWQ